MNEPGERPSIKWNTWGPAAFAAAEGEGRPVLLRVTAFWSREGRVQEDEGDRDPEVVGTVARGFVPVRADADRDPEAAAHLSARRLPATAVLSASCAVRQRAEGRMEAAAFLAFLKGSGDRGKGTAREPPSLAAKGAPAPDLEALTGALLAAYDWRNHGFGAAPKEPSGEPFETALAIGCRRGTPYAGKAALLGLSALPKTEAFDAVEGGFFRECATNAWQEPSLEKLLEVNASLLSAYAAAFAASGGAEHRRVALETARYIDRGLSATEGHLWGTSQAADEEYYAKMAHRRAMHGAPPVDPTVRVDLCASAASAFARAGLCLEEPRLIARGQIALDELFLSGAVEGARVRHFKDEGGWQGEGWLPDHTELGRAALELYCATGSSAWLERALKLARALVPAFSDPDGLGLLNLRNDVPSRPRLPPQISPPHIARASIFLQRVGETLGDGALVGEGRRLALSAPRAAAFAMPEGAALAGALLAALEGTVVVEGPSPKGGAPSAKLARAALALAVPLGAFTLDGRPPKERNADGAVTFRVGERRSPPARDLAELRGALAAVTALHDVP